MTDFETLLHKTLVDISVKGDEAIIFTTKDNEKFVMVHSMQECCEEVTIEDICGDLNDLLNSPVLLAEKVTNEDDPPGISKESQGDKLWTFYKLSTIKGSVTIRWYGTSNGYYSMEVDFNKIK